MRMDVDPQHPGMGSDEWKEDPIGWDDNAVIAGFARQREEASNNHVDMGAIDADPGNLSHMKRQHEAPA